MKTWISSDIHLNHRNILQYCPHRVHESFRGDIKTAADYEISNLVDRMNETIISNWNSMVSPDDEVFILGDVAMGQIVKAPPLIRRLNGAKYLIAGNHDKTLTKLVKNDPTCDDLFVWIKDYHEYSHVYEGKKRMICMSHYPMRYWNSKNQGVGFAHGHLHGSVCDVPGRIMDVGMDTNNLFPYLMDDVVGKLLNIDFFEEHHRED